MHWRFTEEAGVAGAEGCEGAVEGEESWNPGRGVVSLRRGRATSHVCAAWVNRWLDGWLAG